MYFNEVCGCSIPNIQLRVNLFLWAESNAKHSKTSSFSLFLFRCLYRSLENYDWFLQLSTLPLGGRNSPMSSLDKVNQFYRGRPCCHSEHSIEITVSAGHHLRGLINFSKTQFSYQNAKYFTVAIRRFELWV